MAGQLRFSLLNLVTASTLAGRNRDTFTHVFDFFESHPGFERIASYFGTSGTGFGFTNASDQSGENAWVIWRNVSGSQTYDVAWRWSYNSFSDAGTNGDWNCGASDFGVSWAVAFHSSSASFAGTTNNDGADSFENSNPWKSGSLVFPRQSMAGGINAVDQKYSHLLDSAVGANTRINIAGDDDSFVVVLDESDNNVWDSIALFERYNSFYNYSHPYFSYGAESMNALLQNTALGSFAVSNNANGGISTTLEQANEDNGLNLGVFIPVTSYQNLYRAPIPLSDSLGQIQEWPYIVGAEDGQFGYNVPLGYLNLVRNSYQSLTSSDLLGSGSANPRMVQRTATTSHPTLTIPWTGSVEPLTGVFYSEPLVFMTGAFGMTQLTASLKTDFAVSSGESTGSGPSAQVPIFRGENPPGTFVYSEGSPPAGAINVIIIGFK